MPLAAHVKNMGHLKATTVDKHNLSLCLSVCLPGRSEADGQRLMDELDL